MIADIQEIVHDEDQEIVHDKDQEIIDKKYIKYDIGDHVKYYKVNDNKFSISKGLIIKNIFNHLFVVNNVDTNVHEKINYNDIIKKLDYNIDITNILIEDSIESLEAVLESCDIMFLYFFIVLECIVVFIIYLYFGDVSYLTSIYTSAYTTILNCTEQMYDFLITFIYSYIIKM